MDVNSRNPPAAWPVIRVLDLTQFEAGTTFATEALALDGPPIIAKGGKNPKGGRKARAATGLRPMPNYFMM